MIRPWLASCLLVLAVILVTGCGYRPRVLNAPPQAAYKTIGMISGTGENEAAAMSHALAQAEEIEAHAIILVGRSQMGSMTVVRFRVIRYHGDPPD